MGLPRDKIPVLEEFVSIQGEGRNIGVPYVFIRVGGCPLRCRFCDSEYTWTVSQDSIQEVKCVAQRALRKCDDHSISWISITGGEPLIYPGQLYDMMDFWADRNTFVQVQVETSGRYFDEDVLRTCHLFSMDIKTPCTDEVDEKDLEHLKYMRHCDQVKCLIEGSKDLDYAMMVRRMLNPEVPLILQPFNTMVSDDGGCECCSQSRKNDKLISKYKWIVESVLMGKWVNTIITPQIHVLMWGNTPGT